MTFLFETAAFGNRGAAFPSMYQSLPLGKVSGFNVGNSQTHFISLRFFLNTGKGKRLFFHLMLGNT